MYLKFVIHKQDYKKKSNSIQLESNKKRENNIQSLKFKSVFPFKKKKFFLQHVYVYLQFSST